MGVKHIFRKFARERDGATALEFALIAPMFVACLFFIIEVGWLAIRIADVNGAVEKTSRFVYLGRAQNEGISKAELEKQLCDNLSTVSNCTSNIVIEMRVIERFSDIPRTEEQCKENDVNIDPSIVYENGDENEIVFMRVCVTTSVASPYGAGLLGMHRTAEGNYQVVASTAFMNRSYK